MTVSDIIKAARQYTQITGSSWFSAEDELRSINRAYRDIYEKIIESNDEYFIKETTIDAADLVEVRDYVYDYTLPDDWYRLRSIRAVLPVGEDQLDRLDPNNITQAEGYRYFQDKLRLTFRNPYDSFRIEYYPMPDVYISTAQNINYPPQLEPLIIAYQMAMDITKAENGDATKHAEEYARLWQRFELATARRDNQKYPKVGNMYRSTYPGW